MRIFVAILIFVFTYGTAFSQWGRYGRWRRMRYEVIYSLGGTNFLGELGGANQEGTNFLRDLEINQTRPLVSLGMRYKLLQDIAVRTSLSFGYLHGDDLTTLEKYRRYRNLRFRSPLFEWALQLEYSILRERVGHRYNLRRVRGVRGYKVNTYFFAGIAMFWFNPQGKYNGKWYNLQPLCTEGEGIIPTREKYHRLQVSIPFGIGFKYGLNRRWSVGLEFGPRKTFTDYIDDVSKTYVDPELIRENCGEVAAALADPSSKEHPNWTAPGQQRGDAKDKDTYMFISLNLTYKLKQTRRGMPKFR